MRRALKVLSDREVSPQLGLLKSTLLQLDSTFSERTYGAGSFRDFAQKLAAAGHVTLRESGRNVLVELAEGVAARADDAGARRSRSREPAERSRRGHATGRGVAEPAAAAAPPAAPAEPRVADGIREVRRLFQSAQNPPRWPMYIRQAKQFLRNVDASFDERKFGFASLVDLMRACQRDGLFRIERDRQGVMRIFPGNVMQAVTEPVTVEPDETEDDGQQEFLDMGPDRELERDQEPMEAESSVRAVAARAGQHGRAGSRRRRRAPGDGRARSRSWTARPSRSSRASPSRRRKPTGDRAAVRCPQDRRRQRRAAGAEDRGGVPLPRAPQPGQERLGIAFHRFEGSAGPLEPSTLLEPTACRSAARARRSSPAADGRAAR